MLPHPLVYSVIISTQVRPEHPCSNSTQQALTGCSQKVFMKFCAHTHSRGCAAHLKDRIHLPSLPEQGVADLLSLFSSLLSLSFLEGSLLQLNMANILLQAFLVS